MDILPAIDILGGRAVRLAKGDYNAVTVYNDDPAAQAALFKEQGARWDPRRRSRWSPKRCA